MLPAHELTHGSPDVRKMILAAMAVLMAGQAAAQEVQRYVGPDRKPRVVDSLNRLPVSNGPNGDPIAALDSMSVHQSSGGILLAQPLVFYSFSITLSAGQGPGRVMIWDRTTLPADGALALADRPMRCFYVDAGDRTTVFSSASGFGLDRGLVWAFSTAGNCQTKTSATADMVAVSYNR